MLSAQQSLNGKSSSHVVRGTFRAVWSVDGATWESLLGRAISETGCAAVSRHQLFVDDRVQFRASLGTDVIEVRAKVISCKRTFYSDAPAYELWFSFVDISPADAAIARQATLASLRGGPISAVDLEERFPTATRQMVEVLRQLGRLDSNDATIDCEYRGLVAVDGSPMHALVAHTRIIEVGSESVVDYATQMLFDQADRDLILPEMGEE